ncbi:MAG: hypothetical protein JOZ78_27265 [Chroococcidiopsidaceae cyanobacterium CP_BM_ER_R8_30]|nr:hypothetical protein [Chroococcidiopsidaceae cyanobacterium CP_BM_ER_R8_30]
MFLQERAKSDLATLRCLLPLLNHAHHPHQSPLLSVVLPIVLLLAVLLFYDRLCLFCSQPLLFCPFFTSQKQMSLSIPLA